MAHDSLSIAGSLSAVLDASHPDHAQAQSLRETQQVRLEASHSTSLGGFSIATKARHLAGCINPCLLHKMGFVKNRHHFLTSLISSVVQRQLRINASVFINHPGWFLLDEGLKCCILPLPVLSMVGGKTFPHFHQVT